MHIIPVFEQPSQESDLKSSCENGLVLTSGQFCCSLCTHTDIHAGCVHIQIYMQAAPVLVSVDDNKDLYHHFQSMVHFAPYVFC